MKVASYALPSSAIIFFFSFSIVVADLRGLFTNKCMMYTNTFFLLHSVCYVVKTAE